MLPRSSSTASVDRDLDFIVTDSDLDELQSSPSHSPNVRDSPPITGETSAPAPASGQAQAGPSNLTASDGPSGNAAQPREGDGILTKFQLNALTVLHQLCALDDLYLRLFSTMDELPHQPDRATWKILLEREDLLVNPATGDRAKRTDDADDLARMISKITDAQRNAQDNLIPDRLLRRLEKHYIAVLNNQDIVLGISTAVKNQVGLLVRSNHNRTEILRSGTTTTEDLAHSAAHGVSNSPVAGLGFCCFTFPRGVNDVDAQGFNDDLTFQQTYQGKQRLIMGLGIARVINHSCRANVEWPFINPLDFKTGVRGLGYMTAKLHGLAPLRAGDELFGFYGEKFARLDCRCEFSKYHPPQPRSPNVHASNRSLYGRCATPGPTSRPAIAEQTPAENDGLQAPPFETESPGSISAFVQRGPPNDGMIPRKRAAPALQNTNPGKWGRRDHASVRREFENEEEYQVEFGQETDDEDYTPEDADKEDDIPSVRGETMGPPRRPNSSVWRSSRSFTATRTARHPAVTEEDELDSDGEKVLGRSSIDNNGDDDEVVFANHVRSRNHTTATRIDHDSGDEARRCQDLDAMVRRGQAVLERMEAQLARQDREIREMGALVDTIATNSEELQQAVREQGEVQMRVLAILLARQW
ncbi:hypothetical protein I317_04781 [Kwoniella heveanensis CBS 569]|nr:hypothetical protein I317_04781 [Kwoniella heveanensis CBS 569]